jgi:Cu(I)/Ag(I) efflux system membrane fusion protein
MTDRDPQPGPPTHEDAPFGAGATRRVARWRGPLFGIGIVGAAVVVTAWASRRAPAASDATGNRSAAPAVAAPEPVMLSEAQARRIGVTFATVERGVLRPEVRTVAQVTVDETRVRAVTLKFDGWVDRLFVDYTGRDVRAGEPLMSIFSPMLVAAEEELLLAGKLLGEVGGADSATRSNAQALRGAARQRLLNWDVPVAEVDRVEKTAEVRKSLVVRAPYSGVVVDKSVLTGQRVMAGEPLYRIADLSVVWVEGEVFEGDLPFVRLGEAVEVELQALPGRTRTGHIAFLQPTVSTETRTVRVRVELENANGQLKPGMYATVRMSGGAGAPVLHVPRSAVLSTGERDLVFVRRVDGMLEPRDVVRGTATDERVEIKEGIREGETVVASATFLVDAESNLGTMLGGMGGMPGMDMTPPVTQRAKVPAPARPDSARPRPVLPHDHR